MGLLDKLLGRNRTAPSEKSVPARTPAPRPATPTQPAARAATGDSAVLAEINRLVAAFVATRRSPGRPLDDVRMKIMSSGQSFTGSASLQGKTGWFHKMNPVSIFAIANDGTWRYQGCYEWREDNTRRDHLESYHASELGFMEINPFELERIRSDQGPQNVLRAAQAAIAFLNAPRPGRPPRAGSQPGSQPRRR